MAASTSSKSMASSCGRRASTKVLKELPMYDKSDPRASLAPATAKNVEFTAYHPSQYVRFYEGEPQLRDRLARSWFARGQNAITAYSETEPGAQFERRGQVDEWVLLLPDPTMSAELVVGSRNHTLSGGTVTFV